MKLSFSTRGWGDLSWDTWLDTALEMKFTGIEVYDLYKYPALTDRGGPFHKHSVAATVRSLRDKKLTVPCLDTSMDISLSPDNAAVIADMMHYARDAQIPYVVGSLEDQDALYKRLTGKEPAHPEERKTAFEKMKGGVKNAFNKTKEVFKKN